MAPPRKRINETTSPIYRGADGKWHARVTVGRSADGGLRRRHLQRRTKTELQAAVREIEAARDAGTRRWTDTADLTLAEWLDHWLGAILPMTARWKTLATYRSQMHRHVIPTLGPFLLHELEPEDLEHHYRTLREGGCSAHTVAAVHRVLRSALGEAVRRRRLATNPAAHARPPRIPDVEFDPLTIEECQQLLSAAADTPHPPRWSLALSLGLRQGEALGLLWPDVDLETGRLRVRRSVQRWTWQHGCRREDEPPGCGRRRAGDCPERHGGGLRVVEPKTRTSHRTLVLPPPLTEELRRHRAALAERRLAAGSGWDATHDLVFPAPTGGLIDPRRDNAEWNRLLSEAGVRRVRLHDARHTAATLLLLQGVDIRTLMSIMGWTEMATAQRYTHAVDELRTRAAHQMATALWPNTHQA
jgi:integrase